MTRSTAFPARAGVVLLLLGLLALVAARPAAAEDTTCTGTIGAEGHDNIVVPAGASCTLDGTTAEGNVIVGTGATLTAAGVRVDGNIQAEGAAGVTVTGSQVGGSVQLEQGGGATVAGNRIDSDLQMESNSAALNAEGNDIGGNLQANQNTVGLAVVDNTIDGNLQCAANDPAPTGGGNVVFGSAEDQCAALTGDGPGTPSPDPTGTPSPGPTGTPSPGPTGTPSPDPTETARQTGRLSGPDRFATAVAITRAAYPNGADVIYLARADDFADALAGGSLSDGPILLVPACGTLPTVVADEIRRLDPQRVVALGGTVAVCDEMLAQAAAA